MRTAPSTWLSLTLGGILSSTAQHAAVPGPVDPPPRAAALAIPIDGQGAHPSPSPQPLADTVEDFVGVLLPRHSVDLAAARSGIVSGVFVATGQIVSRGARLASLDARQSALERQMAEAELRSADSELAHARLEYARRSEQLVSLELLAQEGLEAKMKVAEAQYARAMAEARTERFEADRSQRATRVALLRTLETAAEVSAPFSGSIAACYVDVGARVQMGDPIVRLVSHGDLIIRFAIPGSARERAQPKARALARSRDVTAAPLEAEIESVAPELDPASNLIIVEAKVRAASGSLLPYALGGVLSVSLPPLASD